MDVEVSPSSSWHIMKRAKMLTYMKRKETIKKKTMELSILCDTKACAILVGPNGEVDTWPENPMELNPIIQFYKRSLVVGKRNVIDCGCLKKKAKKNLALFSDDGDQWLNSMSRESIESLLVKLNLKLEAVEKRIEFLKMVNNGNGIVGDVTGSTSSGKKIAVMANQETHNSDFGFWESIAEINEQLRGEEVAVANQESYNYLDFGLWGNTIAINGDQLQDITAKYNQGREIVMADQETHNSGDQLRDCSAYDQGQEVGFLGNEGQLMVTPDEMNMWETVNNLENLKNFGCDDLWPITTDPEFDLLPPQEVTGFGTLLNQQTLGDKSFMANYDYSIPFSTDTF